MYEVHDSRDYSTSANREPLQQQVAKQNIAQQLAGLGLDDQRNQRETVLDCCHSRGLEFFAVSVGRKVVEADSRTAGKTRCALSYIVGRQRRLYYLLTSAKRPVHPREMF
jgi:hypothetical protein